MKRKKINYTYLAWKKERKKIVISHEEGKNLKNVQFRCTYTPPRECCAVQQGATMNLISANISYYKMQLIQFIRTYNALLLKIFFLNVIDYGGITLQYSQKRKMKSALIMLFVTTYQRLIKRRWNWREIDREKEGGRVLWRVGEYLMTTTMVAMNERCIHCFKRKFLFFF